MKTQIIISALLALGCVFIAKAQWTPDPFCPYPYPDHVTRYPYYGNCSVYWECWEGTKYVMECPTGLEFNAPYERCDTPSLAKCDPFAPTTANPNTPPIFSTGGTTEPQPDGPHCPFPSEELVYFPVENDCTQYWECFEGNRYLYSCPGGLWWHQAISECDYPGDFCYTNGNNETTVTLRPTTDHGKDPRCTEDSDDITYWPEPADCSVFVMCLKGYSYYERCPENTFFDSVKLQCLSADQADCCKNSTCK